MKIIPAIWLYLVMTAKRRRVSYYTLACHRFNLEMVSVAATWGSLDLI